jgi:hypothetical protein
MMDRRYLTLSNNLEDNTRLAIIPSELGLANDFTNIFFQSENKLEYALRLIADPNEQIRKFGIRQLRNFTETITTKEQIDGVFSETNFSDLIDLLIKTEDPKEIFEVTWILIDLTKTSKIFINFINKPIFISSIFHKMVASNDWSLRNHLLWILCNITGDSDVLHAAVMNNTNILDFVRDMFAMNNLPHFFKTTLFWCIGNLYQYGNIVVIEALKHLLPEIAKYLKSDINKASFSEALYAIGKVSRNCDTETITLLSDLNIHITLLPYINTRTEDYDIKMVLSIIGNLVAENDDFVVDMFEKGAVEVFETFLSETLSRAQMNNEYLYVHRALIKDFVWVLANFMAVDNEPVKGTMVRKTKIPTMLLQLSLMTSDKSINEHIIYFFANAIDCTWNNTKTELLRLRVLELFCHHINHPDPGVQYKVLQSFVAFLEFAETIMKDRNIVKEELEMLGITLNIENIITTTNQEKVSERAVHIMDKYYK